MLYPLKFAPVFKDYIWGGRHLAGLGKELPATGTVAESWEISSHPNGVSVISNGSLAGSSLPDAADRYGRLLLGYLLPEHSARKFPLLVKLIDANGDLSIQVHPDDLFAEIHESGKARKSGKNEMWYVVEATPGACLIAGLQPGATREMLAASLAAGGDPDVFQKLPVKAGDAINIPAGLVHAIGKGLVICEIQQNSDVTYRLFDYRRRDAQGRERPLHLEKGLAAVNDQMPRQAVLPGLTVREPAQPDLVRRVLVLNRFFKVEEISIFGAAGFHADGSRFMTLTVIEGQGAVQYDGSSLPVRKGESVLIPASLGDWQLAGSLKAITGQVSDFPADLRAIARIVQDCCPDDLQGLVDRWSGLIGFQPLPADFTDCVAGGG
jgi:mannose-6-phosphate isomerase